MAKRKVHIVTYTHWDREFRWEFERTRMRLVDCIDHLLEIMDEREDYRSFLMDGQLTLLEDYLEIRPEKREKIQELAKAGRLEVGPWYSLADCAPIQGESVVRNLLYGTRKCEEYGGPLKCGYNVFSFGQIGQLPQIYSQFGIDTAIFYKYMDPKKSKYHEFWWESPDGTRALASRLGKEARWNFFFAAHIPIVYDKDAWHKDWQYKWGELGKIFHTADPDNYAWFYDVLDPETGYHKENLRKGMERALATVEGTAAPETVLMFEGTDFTEPHPLFPDIVKDLQDEYGDELEIVHSTLTDYLSDLKNALKDREDLDVVQGPMRDGPVGSIHTDVFSTHPEVMIENSHSENTLVRYAEPLSTFAWKHGIEPYPSAYLEKTWKILFQSHAHDSMHGLGPNTLAEGEVSRLKQAGIIAKGLERRGLERINKEIDTSAVTDTEYFISVHNESSFERSEVVECYVDIPKDARLHYVVIEDMDGNQVEVQEVSQKETRAGIYHPRSRNMPFYCTKVHLFFMAENVPACGYKTYKLKWQSKNEYPYPHEDWDAPRIYAKNLLCGENVAENEYLRVKIEPNGTLTLVNKETGRTYSGMGYLMDMGDKGNMWMYDTPAGDRILNNLGESAVVSVGENGPLAVRFTIDTKIRVPKEYDWNKMCRSEVMTEIPMRTVLTLRKGSRFLECETTIQNTAKDHYLKLCFPTDLEAEKTWADGSFMVTEYPTDPSENSELRGNELARHPMQLWMDLGDGKEGFAILSDATKDYEILEHDSRKTIAVGLVRGTRLRIACDNRLWMEYPGDESAQSLRGFTYRYALMPHSGDWEEAGLYESGMAFNVTLHACQFGKQNGQFGTEHSFLELEGGNLVLSCVKKAEDRDSVIVRIYNPTDHTVEGTLKTTLPFEKAYKVKMDESREEELSAAGGAVAVSVPKGKISTFELA